MKKKPNLKVILLGSAITISALVACSNGSSSSTNPPPPNQPTVADTIAFTPAVITVNNPTGSTPNQPQQITLQMVALGSNGQPIQPSESNPLNIAVYGAPTGVITPISTTSSNGSVTFTYNGASFSNNILINAWIKDNSNNGAAIGVTQILMQNTAPSIAGTESYNVPLLSKDIAYPLEIKASVGYTESSQALAAMKDFALDTGSLGVIVPANELPTDGSVIGPGAYGVKYYDSSGDTFAGHYYLAPVNIKLAGNNVVQTQPILVLAIESAYCSGPQTGSCYSNPPPTPTLHYMGVGFNRNSTESNDLFDSPSANTFLHLTNAQNGTDITPGYYLNPGESGTTGLTLGITEAGNTDYKLVNLTPNPAVPGDFNGQPGCYSFPSLPPPNQFCGTALLDIGIQEMFIDLPKSQWPKDAVGARDWVPLGTPMGILMGATESPAMSYSFTVESPPVESAGAPAYVQWIDSTNNPSGNQIFVNTGRMPLYIYDYMYNGQFGQVGFKSIK